MPRIIAVPLRWPPFVSAWIVVGAGHLLLGGEALPADLETPSRAAALVLGLLSFLLGAAASRQEAASGARVSARRVAALLLAILSLVAAGATLGLEARRRAAPLEVHPRAVAAELRGFVADASASGERAAVLRFDVAEVRVGAREEALAATVRLRWPAGSPPPAWAVAGTPLAARGAVRPLEDARNPGGSPPGRWLERDGIDATFDVEPGSVEPWTPPEGMAGRDRRGGARLASEARRAAGRLLDAHAPAEAAALARGMLLGDRVGIDAETRESFRNAGTLHILSISGLHVCIVAGFVAALARGFGLGAVTGTAVELAALAAYVAFVGAPPPALRSALLWVFARGARLAGRGAAPFAGWGAAGLLLHLANPSLPLDLGFLLSFGAVLGLEAGAALAPRAKPDTKESRGRRAARGILTAIAAGAGAAAGTLPFEIAAFGSLPVAGPVANLVVIPLTTIFLAEAILLATLGALLPPAVGDLWGGALGAIAEILLLANDRLGGRITPLPIHGVPTPEILAASYLALLGIAALRGRHRGRDAEGSGERSPRGAMRRAAPLALLVVAIALPLFVSRASSVGTPGVLFLDVGQGDAALLLGRRGEALAVDSGPRSDRRDEGRLTLEPALRAEGVRSRIDVVSSHGHRDHEGGIVGLAARAWVDRVLENGGGSSDRDSWRNEVKRRGGRIETVEASTRRLEFGPWSLAVSPSPVSAPAELVPGANATENNRSLLAVATLTSVEASGGRRFSEAGAPTLTILFPGDLEEAGEAEWLRAGLDSATILKVPHHGSRTSSTEAWVERVRPRIAVVSAGERNRYRHPSPETLRRYRRRGTWVVRTDLEGAVRITRSAGAIWISTRAHPPPRPWRPPSRPRLSHCFDFP